jgi:hypothetical protein
MADADSTLDAIAAAIAKTPWTPETLTTINAALQQQGRGIQNPWGTPATMDAKAPAGTWLSAEQALAAWRNPERLGYDATSALYNAQNALATAREALCQGAEDQAEAIERLEWVADRLRWASECAAGAAVAVLKGDRG